MDGSNEVWQCLNCAEAVPSELEVCWNCEATRAGRSPTVTLTSDDTEEKAQKEFLNKKFSPKNCVRCNVRMAYAGRKEFHEGMKLGALGDFAELFVNQTRLEMYVCPSCQQVEFFLSDPS